MLSLVELGLLLVSVPEFEGELSLGEEVSSAAKWRMPSIGGRV